MNNTKSVAKSGKGSKSKLDKSEKTKNESAQPVMAVKNQKQAAEPEPAAPSGALAEVAALGICMTKAESNTLRGLRQIAEGKDKQRLFVGVDVHKKQWHVAVWSKEHDLLVASWVTPSFYDGLSRIIRVARARIESVVYEAGPTGFSLARRLESDGWPVQVISPAHTPRKPGGDDKSDRLDARKLAEYSSKGLLHVVAIPTEQEEADRALARQYGACTDDVRRAKMQIRSFLLFHGVAEPEGLEHWTRASREALTRIELNLELRATLDLLLKRLAQALELRSQALKCLRRLSQTERHAASVKRLRTVPGVGLIIATVFLCELFRPKRFGSPRQVSRMLGLAPEVRSSGQSEERGGRHAAGQARLRSLLVEGAWQWRRHDANALRLYQSQVSRSGLKQKAITAVARKLGVILWRIALGPRDYCPGLVNIPPGVFEGMKRRQAA